MSAIATEIVDILSEKYLMGEAITPETPFTQLALDSLVMVELSVAIKRRYGVRLSEDEVMRAGSASDLAAYVEQAKAALA